MYLIETVHSPFRPRRTGKAVGQDEMKSTVYSGRQIYCCNQSNRLNAAAHKGSITPWGNIIHLSTFTQCPQALWCHRSLSAPHKTSQFLGCYLLLVPRQDPRLLGSTAPVSWLAAHFETTEKVQGRRFSAKTECFCRQPSISSWNWCQQLISAVLAASSQWFYSRSVIL